MNESFAFSEVVRKLANLIRLGKISEINGAQVKVQIGRVTTGWLPIISGAGETIAWNPVAVGELVAVFSPYGESAQGFVLRSIHYNEFLTPDDKNSNILKTPNDIKIESAKKIEAQAADGCEFSVGNSKIKLRTDEISLSVGGATLTLSDSNIKLSLGSSEINMTDGAISISSEIVTTNPPICKCTGGL